MPDSSNEQPYDLEVVENNYTLTISGLGATGLQGPVGPTGPAGPAGPAGPGGTWGSITGTLSSQTDLQSALDLKAPLASPTFTGTPSLPTGTVAVTQTTGDNDLSVATTAFVQQELAAGTAVAKNLEFLARNQSGAPIPKGSIVYINGATGNKPLITLAQANNDANSAQTIGFVKTDIPNNGTGFVIVRGEVENVKTFGATEGQQLYLSPTTAGAFTTTKPSAPQHLVYVGIVIAASTGAAFNGIILVAIQNGYELNELHDVAISSPTTGQFLKRNAGNTLWVNSSIASADITDATSAPTSNVVVRRNSDGGASFSGGISGFAVQADSVTGTAVLGQSVSGTGLLGGSADGVGVVGQSDTNTAGTFTSSSGTNHAVFGNTGDNRSFVARLKGAFGWFRGAFTGRIQAADTLTANRTWTLPDTTGTVALTDDPRFIDARTPLPHTHGNISNTGTIGSTAGLPLITGTSGLVQTGTFGSTAGTFCQGNDSRLSDQRTPLDNSATNAKLADMPGGSLKGRSIGAGGDPEDLTGASLAPILGIALSAGVEDTTPADTDRLAVVTPAAGWLSLSRLWDYIKAKLDTALTIAGAWSFSSTTRPTSSGTGTPAANSLITRADGDARLASPFSFTTGSPTIGPWGGNQMVLQPFTLTRPDITSCSVSTFASSPPDVRFVPFWVSTPRTVTTAVIRITAGTNATQTVRGAIYDADANGMPNNRISPQWDFSCAATGVVSQAIGASVVLNRGLYWVALQNSVGGTLWGTPALTVHGYSDGGAPLGHLDLLFGSLLSTFGQFSAGSVPTSFGGSSLPATGAGFPNRGNGSANVFVPLVGLY